MRPCDMADLRLWQLREMKTRVEQLNQQARG